MHQIDELLWDDRNEEHISRRATPEEVEETVFDLASLFLRTKQGRYLVFGLTDAGRYLMVVLEPLSGRRAYPITVREMTDAEKRRFKSR